MSQGKQQMATADNIIAFLGQQEQSFNELTVGAINHLDFEKECLFAKQTLVKNDYLMNVARNNKDSLRSAINNVAAIGITLNPAHSFAYLVPRKTHKTNGKDVYSVCLDISYRGLIKLATDSGAISFMKAELVYENDNFEYKGFHEKPDFSANPFGNRGDLIGCYAMAKLTDGGFLVETMDIDAVNKIRNDSEAYKSAKSKGESSWQYKNCVWVKYYEEMVKKTVIKRAYKTLPQSKGSQILGEAIQVINEHEGINFDSEPQEKHYTEYQADEYKRLLDAKDMIGFLSHRETISHEGAMQLFRFFEEPNIPSGKKGEFSRERGISIDQARNDRDALLMQVISYCDSGDDAGVYETCETQARSTIDWISKNLNPEQELFFNGIIEQITVAA